MSSPSSVSNMGTSIGTGDTTNTIAATSNNMNLNMNMNNSNNSSTSNGTTNNSNTITSNNMSMNMNATKDHYHMNNSSINNNNNNNNHIQHNNNLMTRSYPLRILVHSDAVGAIIGRSGSTIKMITQQTKARIDVHREESPEHQEKVITINGSPDSCSEACFKVIDVVQNEINAKYDGGTDPDRDMTLKILAGSNLIGRLIGKSGSTIKKIMEQTGTRVNISTNSLTESTGEHTIIVVGKLEQARQAERLISSKLRTAYMSDMNNSLQTMSQQPYLFNNLLLPYMPPGAYAQNSFLASIVNSQSAAAAAAGHHGGRSHQMPRSIPISSSHQGQIPNPMYTAAAAAAANTSGYLPFYPNSNVPPTGPGLLGFNPVGPGFEQERETAYIYIPSTMVGAIIGKSGAVIKEMISTSGASIKVATTPPPTTATTTTTNNNTSDPESSDQQPNKNGDNAVDSNKATANSEPTTNSSPEEPSRAGTADGFITASSTSPKVNRNQTNSLEASQQAAQSTRKVTIVGFAASQYSAQFMIYRKVSVESGKGDISLMVEIYVPSQFVGRIIGKGGSTVKNLQKQTRTTIRLPDERSSASSNGSADGGGETCVQITGEFEGSQAAQRYIRNLVRITYNTS